MKVTGRTRIYRMDYDNGSCSYYRKIAWHPYENGSVNTSKWESVIQTVQFAGSKTDIPDGTEVDIIDAFESGYVTKNGERRLKLVVKEFDAELPMYEAVEGDLPF